MARNLSIGMRGDDVAAVQRLLNYHLAGKYAPLSVDGDFGRNTRDRVIRFQTLNRDYPLKMPITTGDGVVKKALAIDGIVGPNTGNVLLDVRTVYLSPGTKFTPKSYAKTATNTKTATNGPLLAFNIAAGDPPASAPPSPPSPPSPAPPSQQTAQFITLAAGGQAQLFPWVVSPFVLSGQFTLLARNAGLPDFLLTAGGQFSQNLGTTNGAWSGQVFGQMSLGNVGLSVGRVDFVNPLVQFMLTGNQGQPLAAGLAIGNQTNLTLSEVIINGIAQPRLSVFLNLQGVVNVGLNNGLCSAPAFQGLLGLGWTFDPFH